MGLYMSNSEGAPLSNNPYEWIEEASERLWADSQKAIEGDEAGLISDEAVRRIMTAALKLYVAKTDGEERTFRPADWRGR